MMWAASGWPGGWVFPFWCGLLLVGRLEGVGGLSARGQSAAHDGQGRQDRDGRARETTTMERVPSVHTTNLTNSYPRPDDSRRIAPMTKPEQPGPRITPSKVNLLDPTIP